MAGDNEILDMSLLEFTEEAQTMTEPIKEEPNKEEENISSIEITDDTTSQEKVGEEGKDPENLEEEDKGENTTSPANSDEVFKPLAEFLKEKGFFTTLEKEITTADDLAEAFREEIKKNEFAQLNPLQKEYLEALSQGIPDNLVQEHMKTRGIFENITDEVLETEEDVRKEVIIQDRMASGWTKERAERDYKRISETGESIEESRISRDNLLQKEKVEYEATVARAKEEQTKAELAAKQQLEDLKNSVYKEDNFLSSFKVTDGLKQKVYETMNTVVDYTPDGLPLNRLMKHKLDNPVEFEKNLYYLYELTNGFKDISKFTTKATTSAAKKLSSAIANSTLIKSGGGDPYNTALDMEENVSPIVDV
jgi:hypothetical protein